MTKGEAKAELDKCIAESTGQGGVRYRNTVTVAECWRRYTVTMQRRWSKSQRDVVSGCWAKIEPAWGSANPNEIDRQALQDWMDGLALSESYLQKIRTYLQAALKMANADGLIHRNPATLVQLPEVEKKRKVFYTVEQLRALISTAEGRERIAVRLLIECGLRPSELFGLRWSDWAGDTLMIDEAYSKGEIRRTKTEASRAQVSVPPKLQMEMQFYRAACGNPPADSWMFPSPVTDRPLDLDNYRRDYLKPLGIRAGLGEIDFRALRRSCATLLHRFGGAKAAQGQLRHASPELTLRVYVQTIPEEVRRAAAALEDALSPA